MKLQAAETQASSMARSVLRTRSLADDKFTPQPPTAFGQNRSWPHDTAGCTLKADQSVVQTHVATVARNRDLCGDSCNLDGERLITNDFNDDELSLMRQPRVEVCVSFDRLSPWKSASALRPPPSAGGSP